MNHDGSVASIIVNWNSSEATLECIDSLKASAGERSLRIVVVDNGSDAWNRERLLERSDIDLLDLGINLGFGSACNLGSMGCRETYLFFMNPDLVAEGTSLDKMARWLDGRPDVAGAGGYLLDQTGAPQYGFMARRFPSLKSAIFTALLLHRLPGLPSIGPAYREGELSPGSPMRVEQPAAACLMLRRSIFEDLEGFDQRFYPAWFEDVDLCFRLWQAGHRLYLVPDARFVHRGAESLSQLSLPEFLGFIYRNQRRYFAKHHGPESEFMVRVALFFGMILRSLLLPFYRDPRAENRKEALLAYWTVLGHMCRSQIGIDP